MLTTGALIDYTRNSTYATTPTARALMLLVFQPVTCASIVPVFNISTNFTPLFLEARLLVCPDNPSGCSYLDNSPILFVSPGYSIPRLYYSVIASAIASEGFIVITIDHPEDANTITYYNGHAVVYDSPSLPTPDEFDQYGRRRAADASFIIDQLSNATAMAELLPQRGPGHSRLTALPC